MEKHFFQSIKKTKHLEKMASQTKKYEFLPKFRKFLAYIKYLGSKGSGFFFSINIYEKNVST